MTFKEMFIEKIKKELPNDNDLQFVKKELIKKMKKDPTFTLEDFNEGTLGECNFLIRRFIKPYLLEMNKTLFEECKKEIENE